MKWIKLSLNWRSAGKVVAVFGAAELVKHADGHFELRGGSETDFAAAKEWISLFQHEAVCSFRPAPLPQPWWVRQAA